MQISSGWMARIVAKVRTFLKRDVIAADAVVETPSAIDMPDVLPAIEAVVAPRPFPRMLSARIACQSKLNVPVGKKPRIAPLVSAKTATRRPKQVTETKSAPKVRSVYLPARHMAAKTRPKSRSNVIMLPIAAKATKAQPKITVSKLQRLAA